MPAVAEAAARPSLLRNRSHRLPTFGVILVITVAAVEAMSVATVMPTAVRSLHGLHYYGWAFTAFFLGDIVGMVEAGRRCDRLGPGASLVGGLVLFASGLTTASAAPDMAVFVTGRALQGLGAGALIVAVYVVVARAFPAELRPRAFAALSAAWVLPALIGPVAAGAVADAFGWRWVFIGIAPLAAIGALALVPVVRRLPSSSASERALPRLGALGSIFLAGGLAALQAGGTELGIAGALIAVAGFAIIIPPLRRLLPAGALRLARGLPTVIVLRGVLTAAFFGAEAYLPLTLTRLYHGSPTVVGIPLTLGALGWSSASWWQGRHPAGENRTGFLIRGFCLVAIGVATLCTLAAAHLSLWVAAPIWAVSGAGMGLAMPTVSVLMLTLSPPHEQGVNTAALQVTDVLGSVIAITAGACVIDALPEAHFSTAIIVVDLALAGVALLGALASRRAGGQISSAA
ncbi:MAG TPA: MFS transporter [Solirubrobacteraceae bacterium]|jgi:MFS family permease|nr:MFS transporter [Solirubrobacteraceae bacterium]